MVASSSFRHKTSAIITGLRRSSGSGSWQAIWPRGIGILLAVALNGSPFFEAGARPPGFVAPAQVLPTSNAPFFREEVVNPGSPHAMSHVPSIRVFRYWVV
jgi:hypothetical protein